MSATGTPLRRALVDYLSLRRAMGYKLHAAGRLLGQFVDYLEERGADTITTEDALAWAMLPAEASPHWLAIRLGAVRGFAAHLHSSDPRVEVPPAGMLRAGSCRATPYLYSQADITGLVHAAAALTPRLRAATYQSLITLLAISGVRIGEAIALDDDDLDADHGALVIRDTKFGKTRLVPLHPTATAALTRYRRLRDTLRPGRAASPALFLSSAGTRLFHSNIGWTFTRLAAQAGLTARSAACRPRIHDLRHSFAVATLLDWHTNGVDVAAMLPKLSAYLGHADPKNTYWYLTASPELMALAGQRLDTHLAAGGRR
jgi:integrase/recombinase XerD